jgi:dihydroorotate dehydrogenase
MAMSQCDRIVRHLEDHGSITAMEAIQEYGIQRLAARIADLREKGRPITSEIVTGKNRYGEDTHYAVYRMAKEEANA